jgi:ubiquinone biosynthesis protein UbiJ
MIERGAVAALNHLLAQQPWAAQRLQAFAGASAEFRCPPFPDLRVSVAKSGLLEPAPAQAEVALTVKLRPGALPLLLLRDEAALKEIHIEGSAELAATVQHLLRHLAWDAEEDLSRFVGDVVAHRLVTQGRAFAAWQLEVATRLAENLAEYWTEEQPLLARTADVANFCRDVDVLRDDVAEMEKRLERLAAAR